MKTAQIALVAFIFLFALSADSYGQSIYNSFVTLGIQGGAQDAGGDWLGYFQLFGDFGPERGVQLRLALRSGLFNSVIKSTFLTTFIINIGTGFQRFYLGAGIGVPANIGISGGDSLQLTALLGLRAPPVIPGMIVALEGGLMAPFDFAASPAFFMSIGASFPF